MKQFIRGTTAFVDDVHTDISLGVGQVIIAWARLDNLLQNVLYSLIGVSQQIGRQAVKDSRCRERFLLVVQLAADKGFSLDATLVSETAAKIEQLNVERDRLAHGTWTFMTDGRGWSLYDTKGARDDGGGSRRLYPQMTPYSSEKFDKLANDIKLISQLLEHWSGSSPSLAFRPPSKPPAT